MSQPNTRSESHPIEFVLKEYKGLKVRYEAGLVGTKKLLDEWIKAKADLVKINAEVSGLFNPLDVIPIGETTHSAILGDLLDPDGSHGQGPLFLNSFLRFLEIPEPLGRWRVTVEQSRVDILLRRIDKPGAVIVENKSNNADDQDNQLYRYWCELIHREHPTLQDAPEWARNSFKVVYLVPGLFKNPGDNTLERPKEYPPNLPDEVPAELRRILTLHKLMTHWINDVVPLLPPKNFRLRVFLAFYFELWDTL